MTRNHRAAKSIKDLVQHYKGEATLFKGQLTDLKLGIYAYVFDINRVECTFDTNHVNVQMIHHSC